MANTARKTVKRLGRPAEASSAETRARLIETAQKHFAKYGYDGATNKDIAAEAGFTSGSIYYYFPSKQLLYSAAADEAWSLIHAHFTKAAEVPGTIVDKLKAVLEAAIRLNREYPHLTHFVIDLSVDGERHSELRDIALRNQASAQAFFRDMAEAAAARGELARNIRPETVTELLVAVTLGLARYAAQSTPDGHAEAVRACERLIEGTLFAVRRS